MNLRRRWGLRAMPYSHCIRRGVANDIPDVGLFMVLAKAECHHGVEHGLNVLAPCTRDRLLAVAANLGSTMVQSRERVRCATRRVETREGGGQRKGGQAGKERVGYSQ